MNFFDWYQANVWNLLFGGGWGMVLNIIPLLCAAYIGFTHWELVRKNRQVVDKAQGLPRDHWFWKRVQRDVGTNKSTWLGKASVPYWIMRLWPLLFFVPVAGIRWFGWSPPSH